MESWSTLLHTRGSSLLESKIAGIIWPWYESLPNVFHSIRCQKTVVEGLEIAPTCKWIPTLMESVLQNLVNVLVTFHSSLRQNNWCPKFGKKWFISYGFRRFQTILGWLQGRVSWWGHISWQLKIALQKLPRETFFLPALTLYAVSASRRV